MLESFSKPGKRVITIILLAICVLAGIGAALMGIDDNPPGFLTAYLAAIAFILAFAHAWRTPRKFLILLLASLLGIILFVVLNIVVDSLVQDPSSSVKLVALIQSPAFEIIGLLIALICPVGIIIGAVGWIVMLIRGRRKA